MPASTTATGDTARWAGDDGAALVGKGRHRMAGGLAVSLVLHAAILLLIACDLLRFLPPPAAPADHAIPVDLVRLEPATSVTDVAHRAVPPQPIPDIDRPRPSPVPQPAEAQLSPTAPPTGVPPAARAAPTEAMTRRPAKAPAVKAPPSQKTAVPPLATPKVAPADPLAARLHELAQQKLAATPAPPGIATASRSSTNVISGNAATAPQSTDSPRDFLRAQVIRHWNLRVGSPQGADWSVSIHLQLRRDGSVAVAEIVDPARYRLNRPYFDFAISARNAVLMSSPLAIPPGQYEQVSDIVLPFSVRDVLQ